MANAEESRLFHELCLRNSVWMHDYLGIKENWHTFGELEKLSQVDVASGWDELQKKIQEQRDNLPASRSQRAVRRRSLHAYRHYLPYAAAVLLLFTSMYFAFLNSRPPQLVAGHDTIIQAPLGSQADITLPDGSVVMLNAGSTIRYSDGFNHGHRDLVLEGEAYFEVASKELPFVVHAFDISLRVTGTEFNLRAYADDDFIEATLVEGALVITDANRERQRFADFELKPSQKVIFHRTLGDISLQAAKQDEVLADAPSYRVMPTRIERIEVRQRSTVQPEISWTEGILIVEGEPLSELARRLERRYNVTFEFEDEQLKGFRYSGTLRDHTLEQVLRAMKLTSPIDYTLVEKTVILRENPETISKYVDYVN